MQRPSRSRNFLKYINYLIIKVNYKAFFLITAFLPAQAYALNWHKLDWKKKREKNNITTYTAKISNSLYPAIKTEMLLSTNLSTVTALVLDSKKCPTWVHRCHSSEIKNKMSDTKYYQYFVSRMPWPYKKRDFLLYVEISQDKELKVSIKAEANDSIYPEQQKMVRITTTQSLWEFIPVSNDQLKIVNYAYVEPKINVPKWLTRKELIKAPYKTLLNMHTGIINKKYQYTNLPFIKNK